MSAKTGTAHHKAKLHPDLVRQIRSLHAEGLSSQRICDVLNWMVEVSTVFDVCTGRTWRSVV